MPRPPDPVRTSPCPLNPFPPPLLLSFDLTEVMSDVGVLLLRTELARDMESGVGEVVPFISPYFLALNDFVRRWK